MSNKKQVIVDVSNLAYMTLHSVESGANNGGAWTTPDVESEFTKRFALSLYSTICEHKADLTVFAMDKKLDGKYWRDDVLSAWNDKHITYFKAGDRFVQRRNGLDYFEDNTKVTKKWLKETKTELEPWKVEHYVSDSEIIAEVATYAPAIPSARWDIDEITMFEIPDDIMLQMSANIDGYKGGRSRRGWSYELPSATFAKLIGGVANYVASIVPNVAVTRVAGYEADDIAATLSQAPQTAESFDEVVLVTKDSDWHQLCRKEYVKLFSLNSKDKELIGFVEMTPEQSVADLEHKILVGDTSDTIPPCMGVNGQRITPTKIGKDGFEASPESYARNKKLIELVYDDDLFTEIQHYWENVWNPIPNASWSNIRVSEIELERTKFNASLNGVFNTWNAGFVIPTNDE